MIQKLSLIACALLLTTSAYAATATGSAANPATTPDAQAKLDSLKDRLASAASQLKQLQKRAIFGTVKATSVSTISIETKTSDIKIELTDTIKVVQILKGKRTGLTTDDLSKGDAVAVFGDYDTNLDLLKAKVVFIQGSSPTRISGTITQTDKKDFTVTIATPEGQSYIVDIENSTKNISWNESDGTSKGAFSKLDIGDTVHVLATPEKEQNRLSAIRILDIGNLTGTTPTLTPTSVASPSATSKTKATPTLNQ